MRIYVSSCVFPGSLCHCHSQEMQHTFTRNPTHTDFLPALKYRDKKAQHIMKKKNVFKKQVGVKKGGGEEERLSYSWYQGSAPEKQTINYCWHEAQPFSRHPAGKKAEQGWAGASPVPGKGFPSRSCSRPADLLLA